MPQKVIPCLSFSINGLQIDNVYNLNFLDLTINCHLDWRPHLNLIGIKIARVIVIIIEIIISIKSLVIIVIVN